MDDKNPRLETRRIVLFLLLTFALTIGFCLLVLYPLLQRSSGAAAFQLSLGLVMFFPALSVLLTRLITREGFQNCWIRPHIKGNVKIYLLAWFGPGALTLLGAGLSFLLQPELFDPNCGYLALTMAAAGTPAEAQAMPLGAILAIQAVQALLLAPLLNFVNCFGEEWGWRGYLLPKMAEKLSPLPMLLLNGLIWGLWHAPLTIIGHNYGLGYWGFPFTGIFAMCLFCIVMGVLFSWFSLKARSCIPAVLAHGGLNGIASIGLYFTAAGGDPFVGPAPTGILGGLPFILTAVLLYFLYFRKQKKMV